MRVQGVPFRIVAIDQPSARSACSRLVPLPMPPRNEHSEVAATCRAAGDERGGGSGRGGRERDHHSTGGGPGGEARSLRLPTPPPPPPGLHVPPLQPNRRLGCGTVPQGGRDLAHNPGH